MEQKPTVMLVDDEAQLVSSLKRHLYKEPYNVITFTSGAEALETLKKQEVDVILSDMRMPQMDGVEFLTKAKEITPLSTRMILSGQSELKQIFSAINQGQIYKYISKPADEMDLKLGINKAIEHYQLQKERTHLLNELGKKNKELTELNSKLEQKVLERTRTIQLRDEILEYFLNLHSLDDCVSFLNQELIGHFELKAINLFLETGKKWKVISGDKRLGEGKEAQFVKMKDGDTLHPACDIHDKDCIQHCLRIPEVGKIILEIKADHSIDRGAIQPFYKFYAMALQEEYAKNNLPQMDQSLDHLIKGIEL